MEEVLVLAHKYKLVLGTVTPNPGVRSLAENQLQDVSAIGTQAAKKTRKSSGQLIIDGNFTTRAEPGDRPDGRRSRGRRVCPHALEKHSPKGSLRRTRSEEFENVCDAESITPYAGPPAALALFNRDPTGAVHSHDDASITRLPSQHSVIGPGKLLKRSNILIDQRTRRREAGERR